MPTSRAGADTAVEVRRGENAPARAARVTDDRSGTANVIELEQDGSKLLAELPQSGVGNAAWPTRDAGSGAVAGVRRYGGRDAVTVHQ